MSMIILVIIVFAISFLLLFIWMYRGEEKANIFHIIIAATYLALVPAVILALFLFAFFGSTTIINTLFGLNISKGQLILLTLSFVIYVFTLDTLIAMVIEVIIRKNPFHLIVLFLIRLFVLYIIGMLFGLVQTSSFIIAIVIALFLSIYEHFYRDKNEEDQ